MGGLWWCVAILTSAALFCGGCTEREPPARAEAPPPSVGVITVAARDIPVSYRFVGQTEATRRVEVRARVAGFITSRAYREGGAIKEGDELFRLDPRPFEADLEVARAELDQAVAELASAESDVARFTELLAADAGSQKEFDDAAARRASAMARIRAAEARIARSELELSYTIVRSPLTGVAGASNKDVGAYVDAGADSLLTEVIETDPIDVYFTVSEREVLRTRRAVDERRLFLPEGGRVGLELTLVDGAAYPHKGELSFADIRVDPATGTTRVRAEFPNPENALRPGQFVRGSLTGYVRANAVAIPRSAVMQSPAGAYAYVLSSDNTVSARPVELGDWSGDEIVIMSGINPGDRVVVDGAQRVGPGMRVTPGPPTPQGPVGTQAPAKDQGDPAAGR